MGVDVGWGGAYKRGPFDGCRDRWGLLFEIVEKREGMRGRRLDRRKPGGCQASRIDANVWRPLFGAVPFGGWFRDELESLILAQNERWRHA
jgi:hypothetical protein